MDDCEVELGYLRGFAPFGERCWVGPARSADAARRQEVAGALGVPASRLEEALRAPLTVPSLIEWHGVLTGARSGLRKEAVQIRRPDALPRVFGHEGLDASLAEALVRAGSATGPAVRRAARIHWEITEVHAFKDGNGRVARFFASIALLGSGLPPLVIPLEDRYSDYGDATDHHDRTLLDEYVLERVIRNTLWWVERERAPLAVAPLLTAEVRQGAEKALRWMARELEGLEGAAAERFTAPGPAVLGSCAAAIWRSGQRLGLHEEVHVARCGRFWLALEPVLCRYDVAWSAKLSGPGTAPRGAEGLLVIPDEEEENAKIRIGRWVRGQVARWAGPMAAVTA